MYIYVCFSLFVIIFISSGIVVVIIIGEKYFFPSSLIHNKFMLIFTEVCKVATLTTRISKASLIDIFSPTPRGGGGGRVVILASSLKKTQKRFLGNRFAFSRSKTVKR